MNLSPRPALRLWFVAIAVALLASACGSTPSLDTGATIPPTSNPTPPPAEEASFIAGGGSSFGECGGYCVTELEIVGTAATLRQESNDGEPPRITTGELTVDGQAALTAANSEISGVEFEEVYGCPDCADGGAEHVAIMAPDGSIQKVLFEYGNPPAALTDGSELLRQVTQSLTSCVSNEFVDVGADCNKANIDPDDGVVVGGAGTEFVGGGTSFGFCGGYCVNTIRLTNDAVTLVATSRSDDEPDRTTTGTLTADGVALLVEARDGVGSEALQEVHGCPDCADGGAQFYDFVNSKGLETRSTFEFGRPPGNTEAASSLILDAIEALGTCTSSDLVIVSDDCEAGSGK